MNKTTGQLGQLSASATDKGQTLNMNPEWLKEHSSRLEKMANNLSELLYEDSKGKKELDRIDLLTGE